MLPYFRQSVPPPPLPSTSRAMSAYPANFPSAPLPVPSVSITPATPQSTISTSHHPYAHGGGADEHGFSTVTLTSSFDDDDQDDEKAAKDEKRGISTPKRLTAYTVPPSRRFRHPEQHRQSLPPLLPIGEEEQLDGKKRRCFFCRILVALVLVCVAVGLGVGLSAKDLNVAPAQGGKGGTPPPSLLAAENEGLGVATRTTAVSVVTSALLTMPVEQPEETTSWTTTSKEAMATPTSTPTLRWAAAVGNGGAPAGVLARTGHGQQRAARLTQRKKQAKRFHH